MPADICILTPEAGYKEHWNADAEVYSKLLGKRLEFRCWADPGDLTRFRLILPLLAWGYQRRPAYWYQQLDAWEAANLPFANPIPILRWNTDKDYLIDLDAAGVATVPTVEVPCLCRDDLEDARDRFGCQTLVVKPSISGGADKTYRLGPDDAIPFDVLEREMLIQPLMSSISEEGEYSLFYFGGSFSHAILKRPAAGDFRVQEQYGGRETAVEAPAAALALALATLSAAPPGLRYARIDMLRDPTGAFVLMELEAIEPSLFLQYAADKGAAFAAAIKDRLVDQSNGITP